MASSLEEDKNSNETRTNGKGSRSTTLSSEETEINHQNKLDVTKNRMASVTNLALENIGLDTKMEGPTWTSKWEAISATLSFVTCSGNFWFFPFLCVFYGGWFPWQFTFCFIFIAVPLLYMETALGQYASASPLSVFSRMAPAMAGLSAGMCFILIFRTVSLSVWATYDLTITAHAAQSAWTTPPWNTCPSSDVQCVDYKLNANCTWAAPGWSKKCDEYQKSLIETRGITMRKSPFIAFAYRIMFKRSVILSDWAPPELSSILSAVFLWTVIGIVSIGGSKVLGKTGIGAVTLLFLGTITLLIRGILFKDTLDVVVAFFYQTETQQNQWMWVWSWTDAAAHSLRALNVGSGGIQKFASLNKFENKITRDVLLISIISYIFYICTGLFSYMYMAEIASFYYPNEPASERITLYSSPVIVEMVISETLKTLRLGSFWVFIFWLTMAVCCMQGIAGSIYVVSSMVLERVNGSRRKYGKPLASWHKRAAILAVMCFSGLITSLPFLGNGGLTLMSIIEIYSSYGTLFIAFIQIVTVSYIYGFKRFSVNIRAMIGGHGPPNIFWWFNWLVITPFLLLVIFGCFLTTFTKRQEIFYDTPVVCFIGWVLVVMPMIFVVFYFIREKYDRRKNVEPFGVLLRATGDWGPMTAENRRKALQCERQLRVRY